MLQDICMNVKESLMQKHIISEYQADQLMKNMKYWKLNDTIYPGTIMAKINAEINMVYTILDFIKDLGILEVNYEIYCQQCNKFNGKVYRTLGSIPKGLCCDECNHIIDIFTDTIVIYRVVKDGR